MNLGNVFIGFTKDGKEICVLKKNKVYFTDCGSVNATVYENLETKEEIDVHFIDQNSLVPYIPDLQVDKKRMSRRKVVKVYQENRSMLLDTQALFYGSIVKKESNFAVRCFSENVLQENVLFTRLDDPDCKVMDLHTSCVYPRRERTCNGMVALEERQINYEQFDAVMQPKRLILEKNYRKEL